MAFTISKTTCLLGCSKLYFLIIAFTILICSSCQNEADPPFSIVPEIKLLNVSHDTIVEYQDVLVLTVEYKDGDGDIGFLDPDVNAIFVRDARLENFDGFYIGPVTPIGANVPIQGQVDIEFPSVFLFGSRETETTRFYIKLLDRAGQESNMLETPPVVIKRAN